MKLENQVVSLELAREMKELGAEQDSIWYWIQSGEYIDDWSEAFLKLKDDMDSYNDTGCCSAHTAAELGDMLPIAYNSHELIIDREPNGSWNVHYISELGDDPWTYDKKVADALAKMWILRKTTLLCAGKIQRRYEQLTPNKIEKEKKKK